MSKDFECSWCHTKFTDQGQFSATPVSAETGFATINIQYDVQCFNCWRQTSIVVKVKSPLHVIDGDYQNV